MLKSPFLCLVSFFLRTTLWAGEQNLRLVISAGEFDRRETVVFINLPFPNPNLQHFELRDSDGNSLPFQVDETGQGCFIEKNLKRATSKSYRLIGSSDNSEASPFVQATKIGSEVKVKVGGQSVLDYRAGEGELPRPEIKPIFRRGGYIHPLYTPSGKIVTDDYPANHLHHHGIWFSWTKTEFEGGHPNFWEMGERKGTVEFVALERTWSGPVQGGFRALHHFVDLRAAKPKGVLNETWEVKVYGITNSSKPLWVFDLVSTQVCASSSSLVLPKYHYGGMGFRGNGLWNGQENTFFLTSEGETDRVKGNETRGRWCHIGGKVDGDLVGVAIFCHSNNFRAPQPMRLHPSEPFFCFAPSQLGDWQITPEKPYVARYRFIVMDGPPEKTELERMWNDYAYPPVVKVEAR